MGGAAICADGQRQLKVGCASRKDEVARFSKSLSLPSKTRPWAPKGRDVPQGP
jgi:hypothetical protein